MRYRIRLDSSRHSRTKTQRKLSSNVSTVFAFRGLKSNLTLCLHKGQKSAKQLMMREIMPAITLKTYSNIKNTMQGECYLCDDKGLWGRECIDALMVTNKIADLYVLL